MPLRFSINWRRISFLRFLMMSVSIIMLFRSSGSMYFWSYYEDLILNSWRKMFSWSALWKLLLIKVFETLVPCKSMTLRN